MIWPCLRGEDIADGITRVTEHLEAWRSGAPLDDLCDHLVSFLAVEPQLDDVLRARRKPAFAIGCDAINLLRRKPTSFGRKILAEALLPC